MKRQRVFTGAPWEPVFGYCRAIRIGNTIEVSGTVAVENGQAVAKGDPYGQSKFVLQRIENALQDLGASLQDVVRTRVFVTNVADWEEIARAHGEAFSEICPVSSLMEVSALIHPDCVVEIEARAILDD